MRRVLRTAVIGTVVAAAASGLLAQATRSAQSLFEAGLYAEALARIDEGRRGGTTGPADAFLAAQIALKLEDEGRARSEIDRVGAQGDEAWRFIADSMRLQLQGNVPAALAASESATARAQGNFFAHYQEGLVRAELEDWGAAAEAFERATKIDPAFAYGQYYAGFAYSRIRRADRTARHFEAFLKLAPKAPERLAVESIMRTLRG